MLGELEVLTLVAMCFYWYMREEGEGFQEGTQYTHVHLNAAVGKFCPVLYLRVLFAILP